MKKPLSRCVALLLASCLAADPMTSAAFYQPLFPVQQGVGAHERFEEDALQAELLAAYTTLENQRTASWLRRQAGAVLLQWVRDRVHSWPLHVAAANRFLLAAYQYVAGPTGSFAWDYLLSHLDQARVIDVYALLTGMIAMVAGDNTGSVETSRPKSKRQWAELLWMIAAATDMEVSVKAKSSGEEEVTRIEQIVEVRFPKLMSLGKETLLAAQEENSSGFVEFLKAARDHPEALKYLLNSFDVVTVSKVLAKDPAGVSQTLQALSNSHVRDTMGELNQPNMLTAALRGSFQKDPSGFAQFLTETAPAIHIVYTLMGHLTPFLIRHSMANNIAGVARAIGILAANFKEGSSDVAVAGSRGKPLPRSPQLDKLLADHLAKSPDRLGKQAFQKAWRVSPDDVAEILVMLKAPAEGDLSSAPGPSELFYSVLGGIFGLDRLRKALSEHPDQLRHALSRLMRHHTTCLSLANIFGRESLQRCFDKDLRNLGWLVEMIGSHPDLFKEISAEDRIGLPVLRQAAERDSEHLVEFLRVLSIRGNKPLFYRLAGRLGWSSVRELVLTDIEGLMREIRRVRRQKGLATLLDKFRRWLWAQLFGSLYDDLRDLRRKYPDLKHNRAVLKEKVSQVIQRWIDAHRRRLSLSRWLLKRPRGGKIYYRNILIGDRELALYAHVWAPTPRGKVRARQRPHLYYDEMEALIPLQDGLVIENYEAPKLAQLVGIRPWHWGGKLVDLRNRGREKLAAGQIRWLSEEDPHRVYHTINESKEAVITLKVSIHPYHIVTTFVRVEGSNSRYVIKRDREDDPTVPLSVQLRRHAREVDPGAFRAILAHEENPLPELYTRDNTALITRQQALDYFDVHQPRVYLSDEGSYLLIRSKKTRLPITKEILRRPFKNFTNAMAGLRWPQPIASILSELPNEPAEQDKYFERIDALLKELTPLWLTLMSVPRQGDLDRWVPAETESWSTSDHTAPMVLMVQKIAKMKRWVEKKIEMVMRLAFIHDASDIYPPHDVTPIKNPFLWGWHRLKHIVERIAMQIAFWRMPAHVQPAWREAYRLLHNKTDDIAILVEQIDKVCGVIQLLAQAWRYRDDPFIMGNFLELDGQPEFHQWEDVSGMGLGEFSKLFEALNIMRHGLHLAAAVDPAFTLVRELGHATSSSVYLIRKAFEEEGPVQVLKTAGGRSAIDGPWWLNMTQQALAEEARGLLQLQGTGYVPRLYGVYIPEEGPSKRGKRVDTIALTAPVSEASALTLVGNMVVALRREFVEGKKIGQALTDGTISRQELRNQFRDMFKVFEKRGVIIPFYSLARFLVTPDRKLIFLDGPLASIGHWTDWEPGILIQDAEHGLEVFLDELLGKEPGPGSKGNPSGGSSPPETPPSVAPAQQIRNSTRGSA